MTAKPLSRTSLILTIVLLNVGLDQITKYAVRATIAKNEIVGLFFDSILLKNINNSGAALGIGSDLPTMLKTIYFQILPIIFLLYLFRMIIKSSEFSNLLVIGIAFAIGGGFGNVIDRIIDGYVTDFIILNYGFFKNGVFNLADISIIVGIILVFTEIFMNWKKIEHSE